MIRFSSILPILGWLLGLFTFQMIFSWAHYQLSPLEPFHWLTIWQRHHSDVLPALKDSFKHVSLSFTLAWALAFSTGPLMAKLPILKGLASPFLVFFQTVPLVTIAPFVLVFLGFNEGSLVLLATIVAFFPTVNGVITGLTQWPSGLKDLIQWAQPSSLKRFLWVTLPRGLLIWIPTAQVAWGLALVGSVIAEFYVGSGLGYLLELARAQNQVDLMIGCTVAILILGLVGFTFFSTLGHIYLRWRPFSDFS